VVAGAGDVWSLGMTLVETLTQHPPALSSEKQADPIVPPTLPQPFLDIARHCLRRDPLLRWTTEQIADCLNPAPVQVPAPGVAPAGKKIEPAAEMWEDITYTWVVLCRSYFFHMRQNLFFRHRIPLAYTDPLSPVPNVVGPFQVRCDDCGKTYVYKRSDLRRYEGEVPKFTTHPLFEPKLWESSPSCGNTRSLGDR
jgi:serine/threonine protein kinase